jgi:tRNA dimethylallyltransferase
MGAQNPPATLPSEAILIAGPTAAGKSEVALLLAERVGGEIISVDSMQVYRGLDIGTAKPSVGERERVRHHLIDIADLSEPFDVARFVGVATDAVSDICSRGKIPILCGGTGLYFQALQGGLGRAPASNPALRAQLEAMAIEQLLSELAERDPVTYERIDRANPRRVIRALEVIRLTGRPFSELRSDWSQKDGNARAYLITRSSTDLQRRIDMRVDAMFEAGLIDETRRLLETGLRENRTAKQALGYRQVIEHLEGQRSLEQTVELVKIRTRQFAKRQRTWFQKHGRWTPVRLESESEPGKVADQIAAPM